MRQAISLMLGCVVCVVGCTGAERSNGSGPADYAVELTVERRPELLPSIRAFASPVVDTATITVRIDSVAGDSLFGSYTADFRHLAIRVGLPGVAAPSVSGVVGNGHISLVLSPNTADGRLHMAGNGDKAGGIGTWYTEAGPRTSGTFRMTAVNLTLPAGLRRPGHR